MGGSKHGWGGGWGGLELRGYWFSIIRAWVVGWGRGRIEWGVWGVGCEWRGVGSIYYVGW